MQYVDTIDKIRKYFNIKELVSEKVYRKYGEKAWEFFDPRLLEVLVWIRHEMGIPMVINNWASGGQFQQRGYRANMDDMIVEKTKKGALYCSAHMRGQGVDFSSGRASAVTIRNWIRAHAEECPYRIRLEDDKSAPTWVHVDVCNTTDKKTIEFSA